MKILKIKEPYWSAWQKYGWKKKMAGVGISNVVIGQALREGCNVYLYVGKDPVLYMIDPQKIMELSNKYNSRKTVGRGVRVAIVPLDSLVVVQGIRSDKKLTEAPAPRSSAGGGKSRTIQEIQDKIRGIQESMRKKKAKRKGSLF